MNKKNLEKKIEEEKSKTLLTKPFPARFEQKEFDAIEAEAKRQDLSINTFLRLAAREMIETLAKKKTG